jgi:hypothetical protein
MHHRAGKLASLSLTSASATRDAIRQHTVDMELAGDLQTVLRESLAARFTIPIAQEHAERCALVALDKQQEQLAFAG